MSEPSYLTLVVIAFALEVVDASFGMGYGTILTPALLLLGYDALQVVPAVIASQLVGDFLAAFFHHQSKNVDLSIGSRDFQTGAMLAAFSLVGSVAAVLFALKLSEFALNLYIGLLVLIIGVVVLITREKQRDFSWLRLLFLGSIASFNKGLSGGGYGPVVTAGQILTGVDVRAAIGITMLAEGVACISSLIAYVWAGKQIDWLLALTLAIGVALSTPVAALIVKKMQTKYLKVIIGVLTLALGILTVLKTVRVL
ncbi:MAG TPA: sulfite exporter TauE/SafE family protein [Anaerolineae bacterium]|nr:sulfite exporter TauE/SafE family protein [Anaerolineae bacterium]